MKYCEEYAALLDAYFDGECTSEEADRVREHIAVCPGCRAYLDDLALLRSAFPDGEDTEVPEGFAGGVMAAIQANAAPRKRRRTWRSLLPMAACLAVILLAAGTLPRQNAASTASAAAEAAPSAAQDAMEESAELFTTSGGTGGAESARDVPEPANVSIPDQTAGPKNDAVEPNGGSGAEPAAEPEDGVAPTMYKAQTATYLAELTVTAAQAEGLTEGWTLLDTGEDGAARYTLTPAQFTELLNALGDGAPAYEPGEGELALVTVVP